MSRRVAARRQPVERVLVDREPLGELVQADVVLLEVQHAPVPREVERTSRGAGSRETQRRRRR